MIAFNLWNQRNRFKTPHISQGLFQLFLTVSYPGTSSPGAAHLKCPYFSEVLEATHKIRFWALEEGHSVSSKSSSTARKELPERMTENNILPGPPYEGFDL